MTSGKNNISNAELNSGVNTVQYDRGHLKSRIAHIGSEPSTALIRPYLPTKSPAKQIATGANVLLSYLVMVS